MKKLFIFVIMLCALVVVPLVRVVASDTLDEQRARLQADLEAEERAIAQQTTLLQAKQRETSTLKGELDLLQSQIAGAQARIKAKRVEISRLDTDISARTGKINTLAERIAREQLSLAELLRKTKDFDDTELVEVVLEGGPISEVFGDYDQFQTVQKSLHTAFANMRSAQATAADEKAALETRKVRELDAQKVIEREEQVVKQKQNEKKVVLNISKGQEAGYQQVLKQRQARAAQIRSALFALRDTAAIPFGKALEYATVAYKKTGVRPAFLLAILTQESNLGENVGSCVITNLQTGQTRSLKSGTIFANGIHPVRDLPILQVLLRELGRDPLVTNVSCPFSVGYGGAMGPAQFIPSTWSLMKAAIASAVGKSVPDPWDPLDAFVASALYLRDLGASVGGYSAEVNAACRYYSGKSCSAGTGATYGSQVMAKASNIQLSMIDPLQDN